MKVTKRISEYVASEVNKKYQPQIDELKDEMREEKEKVNLFIKELTEKWNAELNKLLADNQYEGYKSWNYRGTSDRILTNQHVSYRAKDGAEQDPRQTKVETLERECKETIDNILVSLELGGSKADLDRMLKEVTL